MSDKIVHGHAALVSVRVPFQKTRRAWEYEGRRVMLSARGPLPLGAVQWLFDVTNSAPARYLDLKTGEVYSHKTERAKK